MTDDVERLRREELEVEGAGAEWARRRDEFLVGYVATPNRPSQFHTPAIVEMQRRQVVAIHKFNETSEKQANIMIRLTQWIIALTIILGFIAALQLWAMLAKGGA